MNIHEYQAKELLKKFGVPVLKGQLANTPDEAVKAAQAIGGSVWVVKAQVHAGGRGKGGGAQEGRQAEGRLHGKLLLGGLLVVRSHSRISACT